MKATVLLSALLVAGIVWLAPRGLAELDFRRAEAHQRAGDVEKAETACASALRRRPDHAGARALMKILRPPYRCGNSSSPERWALDLIDRELQYGHRFLEGFDLEAAEGQFRVALELVKVVPPIAALEAREDAARGGLERIAAMLEDR